MNQLTKYEIPTRQTAGGAMVVPQSVQEAISLAELMARAKQAVPKPFRDEPGLCFSVLMQALRWEMDPFAVARKAYVVNDMVAFEAQLIAAVVNTRAGLREPLEYEYDGEGQTLTCTVAGTFASGAKRSLQTPPLGSIRPQNSPLWKSDPQQQLGYYAVRAWARRYCPEVILGVYDREEAASGMIDVTPAAKVAVRNPLEESPMEVEDEADVSIHDAGEPHRAEDRRTRGSGVLGGKPSGGMASPDADEPGEGEQRGDAGDAPPSPPADRVEDTPPEDETAVEAPESPVERDEPPAGTDTQPKPNGSQRPSLRSYAAILHGCTNPDAMRDAHERFWEGRGETWKAMPIAARSRFLRLKAIYKNALNDADALAGLERDVEEIMREAGE